MEQPFVILAANGMQSESSSSSDGSAPSSVPTTPPPRTHDTSHTKYHVRDITEFAAKLDQAVNGVFPNRERAQSRYQDVQVVLMRWEDDDRLGVSCESEDLAKVFAEGYGFKTTLWLIPTEDPLDEITSKAIAMKKEAAHEGRLLIVYYGGHAMMNDARQQIWLRTGKPDQGVLEWYAVQPLFMNAKADVLFLLDCCAAASATTTSNSTLGIKETIAACGFESQAPEPGSHSFTNVLIEVLEEWKHRALFSAAMLHSEILARLRHPKPKKDMFGKVVEARRSPVYVVTTSNAKAISIELARRVLKRGRDLDYSRPQKRRRVTPEPTVKPGKQAQSQSASPISSTDDSDDEHPSLSYPDDYQPDKLDQRLPGGCDLKLPHVLLSLALEGEQLLDHRAWKDWVHNCPALVKYMRIEGMFKSQSTLLLISLPVVIWNLLPDDHACSFIGYVDSVNHLRDENWEDNPGFTKYQSTQVRYLDPSGKITNLKDWAGDWTWGALSTNPTTAPPVMQSFKRQTGQMSHNYEERRRQDRINELIQELYHLVPFHRLEDPQKDQPLELSISRANARKIPSILDSSPPEKMDKGLNNGDVLAGAVSWTRDLMWILHIKLQQQEELANMITDLGGTFPFEPTEPERRVYIELKDAMDINDPTSFQYSRAPGTGLRVPKHTDANVDLVASVAHGHVDWLELKGLHAVDSGIGSTDYPMNSSEWIASQPPSGASSRASPRRPLSPSSNCRQVVFSEQSWPDSSPSPPGTPTMEHDSVDESEPKSPLEDGC